MTKLSKSQIDLLTAAAVSDTEAVVRPDGQTKAISALIKAGLMAALPSTSGPGRLLITTAGRSAVGIAPADKTKPEPVRKNADETPAVRPGQPAPAAAATGKIATLLDLLGREGGATIEAMMISTGWQAHSVRGAISGSIKKKLGRAVMTEKVDGVRTYRVEAEASQ